MRVLVTGATGFIGRHLCRRLLEQGDQVVALVRPGSESAAPSGVEVFSGDLSLFADSRTVLPSCDVVIHLAGVVAAKKAREYQETNYGAVTDLLACLRRQSWTPQRFLFASSLAAAGPSAPDRPWTEDDPPQPIDAYGAAKARAEEAVRQAPFPTTMFRPPIVLGPGDGASLTIITNRALGLIATSKTGPIGYGVALVNKSTNTYNTINLNYTGELWRNNPAAQPLLFGYFIDAAGTNSTLHPDLWDATNGIVYLPSLNVSFPTSPGTLIEYDSFHQSWPDERPREIAVPLQFLGCGQDQILWHPHARQNSFHLYGTLPARAHYRHYHQ